MKKLILWIQTIVFYIGYFISIFWFSTTGILLCKFLPSKTTAHYIIYWNRFIIVWLKWTCNLSVNVIGEENLPTTAYVALSKHQSSWETYFLQYYLAPVSIVLKRELLNLPFFGWGLRLTNPIAIDRGSPKQALKQTLEQGKIYLDNNQSVLIFPEGTRTHSGKKAKYARGGANIAVAAGVPVIPIAHNAGEFWPVNGYIKYPGTVTVKIGSAISSSDFTSREITEQVSSWIEAEVAKMDKRAIQ